MQTTSHLHRYNLIAQRGENLSKRVDPVGVGTGREANENLPVDPKSIPAFKSSRRDNVDNPAIVGKFRSDCVHFPAARLDPHVGHDGNLIEYERGVLYEGAIGKGIVHRQFNYMESAIPE